MSPDSVLMDSRDKLVATQVGHVFQGDAGPLAVLDNVAFKLESDEFVCLVGPSGCGKSTLLRILAGLLEPTGGTITLDGRPVVEPQRQVGLVFQQSNLMPWRSVIDNIALPLELSGMDADRRYREAGELVSLVGPNGAGKSTLLRAITGLVAWEREITNH